MKKCIVKLLVATLLLSMLLPLIACTVREDAAKITDCTLLPSMPTINDLWGAITSSGGLSEYANQHSGVLNTSGTNYLILMCYGEFDSNNLNERLRFTLISGEDIYYDNACVTVGEIKSYSMPTAIFNGVAQKDLESIVVVPFEMKEERSGILHINSMDKGDAYYQALAKAQVGHATVGTEVGIDRIAVGYLDAKSYNDGAFEDSALTDAPTFTEDAPTYMVLDFAFAAKEENEGDLLLHCNVCFPALGSGAVTVEAAPTTKIEQVVEQNVLRVRTTFSILPEKDAQKSARVILRLNPQAEAPQGMQVLFSGASDMILTGTTDIVGTLDPGGLPSWQSADTPVWALVLVVMAITAVAAIVAGVIAYVAVVPEWWEWLIPVLAAVVAFVCSMLMCCCTLLTWWAMLLIGLVGYAILLTTHFVAAKIVDDNVGKLWPIIVSLLLSSVAWMLLTVLAPWVWWGTLLASIGIMMIGAAICGAIGYVS